MTKQAKAAADASVEEVLPSLDEWRRLYEAAIRVKELEPWKWMDERQVFGVQNPETGELGFVSLMGMAREHFAVAVYLGAEGLYGFWEMEVAPSLEAPEQILEIPQLQASFEDRNILLQPDRYMIKKLGLRFRGAKAWPMFRSIVPGYAPWFLTGEEARFLTHILTQTLDVAPRAYKNRKLLVSGKYKETNYLVRVPHKVEASLDWEDQVMRIEPPEHVPVTFTWDQGVLDQLKQLPLRDATLDLDLQMVPRPAMVKDSSRPFLPYALALVESRIGVPVGLDLMEPANSKRELWAQVPVKLSEWLFELKGVPKELRVRSEVLHGLLAPLAKELGIELKLVNRLSALDDVLRGMNMWLDEGEW